MNSAEAGSRGRRSGSRWLWLAACLGCVHAGFSFYWLAGGTSLLETVGQWAVQAATEGGSLVTAGLAGIGVLKFVAALALAVAVPSSPVRDEGASVNGSGG